MKLTRAALMDIDGTLLASVDAQIECWLQILLDFGYPVTRRQVQARIGMGHDRMLYQLCGLSEASGCARRMLSIREARLRSRYLPWLRTMPHAAQFLEHLRNEGWQVLIATSVPRSEAFALLGHAQLLTAFDHVLCKEDAPRTKPAGDIVRAALRRAGVGPDDALFFASSPYDLAAAHAASVPSIALRSGGWPESALADATDLDDDVEHLLASRRWCERTASQKLPSNPRLALAGPSGVESLAVAAARLD